MSPADERVRDVRFSEDSLMVELMDGRAIHVPLAWYPRLSNATPAQRNHWEVCGGGFGIHWPELDEDLSTEGLLRGAPAQVAAEVAAEFANDPSFGMWRDREDMADVAAYIQRIREPRFSRDGLRNECLEAAVTQAQTTPPAQNEDMPAEIDFSSGKRGQFCKAGTQINLPDLASLSSQARLRAGEELRAFGDRLPLEELTPEIEQEIVDLVRTVRAEMRAQRELMANRPTLAMTTIQIELPDDIVQAAQAAGLLTPESLERLFTRAIERRQAADALLSVADRVAAAGIAPMSMQEINAEVKAYRAERHQRTESGHVLADSMKDEYDFSDAQQGKFYKADMRLIPPATDEGQAVDELRALLSERQAQAQRGELMGGSITDVAAEAQASSPQNAPPNPQHNTPQNGQPT